MKIIEDNETNLMDQDTTLIQKQPSQQKYKSQHQSDMKSISSHYSTQSTNQKNNFSVIIF